MFPENTIAVILPVETAQALLFALTSGQIAPTTNDQTHLEAVEELRDALIVATGASGPRDPAPESK